MGAGQAPASWGPHERRAAGSTLRAFRTWLEAERGVRAPTYHELWTWSTTEPDDFWRAIWDFFALGGPAPDVVTNGAPMPDTEWFPGARLNYAERVLRAAPKAAAIVGVDENGDSETIGGDALRAAVAAAAGGLVDLGVRPGDRVCAVVPNRIKAAVALLACASIGAVWASCGPEYGATAILDRFGQLEPSVLFTCGRYRYGGRDFDLRDKIATVTSGLPSLRATIDISPGPDSPPAGATPWAEFAREGADPGIAPVAFDHPLWVLFSSGTTGAPKALVQSHGGITIEHLKAISLHLDVHDCDRLLWYTTPSWMMWNYQLSALMTGAGIVLYDGHPGWPTPDALWRAAAAHDVTVLGTSPGYVRAGRLASDADLRDLDLSSIRTLATTGAPLGADEHGWLHGLLGADVLVAPVSGGTDVCSGFVGPNPEAPEYVGEMQCRMLGAAVAAYGEDGSEVIGRPGELVVTGPMPSMPLRIWGDDAAKTRYRASYFDRYPGVWRHGDWITISDRGTATILGRSDATLNRGGVRMGSAEFYDVIETVPHVVDSLIVDLPRADSADTELVLFVVADPAAPDALDGQIQAALRRQLSPRHVVDRIVHAPSIPRTATGKKCEVPVKRILMGAPVDAAQAGAVADPDSLDFYVSLAAGRPDPIIRVNANEQRSGSTGPSREVRCPRL